MEATRKFLHRWACRAHSWHTTLMLCTDCPPIEFAIRDWNVSATQYAAWFRSFPLKLMLKLKLPSPAPSSLDHPIYRLNLPIARFLNMAVDSIDKHGLLYSTVSWQHCSCKLNTTIIKLTNITRPCAYRIDNWLGRAQTILYSRNAANMLSVYVYIFSHMFHRA